MIGSASDRVKQAFFTSAHSEFLHATDRPSVAELHQKGPPELCVCHTENFFVANFAEVMGGINIATKSGQEFTDFRA